MSTNIYSIKIEMIQIIHLSVVSLFNGKDTFEIHHQQQQQCLKIVLFYAPFFVFKTVG